MMTSSPLSVGTVKKMCEKQGYFSESINLQVIHVKHVDSTGVNASGIRYRLTLSDSINSMSGVLSANLNSLIDTNQVDTMSIIQITSCSVQSYKDHWLLKIAAINPTNTIRMMGKIGDPIDINSVMPALETGGVKAPLNNQQHPPQKPAYQPQPQPQQQQSISGNAFMSNSANRVPYNAPHDQSYPAQTNPFDRRPMPATIQPPSTGHPQINSDEVMAFNSKQAGVKKPPPIKKMAQTMQSATTMPISALSPYTEGWTIRARCTQKGDIRTWTNPKGEGKLFSAVVIDGTGEIRITAFNEQVDQFYEVLQPGQTYAISSGQVRPSREPSTPPRMIMKSI